MFYYPNLVVSPVFTKLMAAYAGLAVVLFIIFIALNARERKATARDGRARNMSAIPFVLSFLSLLLVYLVFGGRVDAQHDAKQSQADTVTSFLQTQGMTVVNDNHRLTPANLHEGEHFQLLAPNGSTGDCVISANALDAKALKAEPDPQNREIHSISCTATKGHYDGRTDNSKSTATPSSSPSSTTSPSATSSASPTQ